MAYPSLLIRRPAWIKQMMKWISGQWGCPYFVSWSRGEIAYEEPGVEVFIDAEMLLGEYERVIRRNGVYMIGAGDVLLPIDEPQRTKIIERVTTQLTRARVRWRVE